MVEQRIVPYAFPESNAKFTEVGIEKMSITYIQEDDTNHGGRDDVQTLTIETEDAICNRDEAENEQGYYLVIKTDRWAIDEPSELTALVEDFKSKLYKNVRDRKKVAQKQKEEAVPNPLCDDAHPYCANTSISTADYSHNLEKIVKAYNENKMIAN